MRSFPCERGHSIDGVERYTKTDKVCDPVCCRFSKDMHRLFIAQAGPGGNCVLKVHVRRIVFSDGSGNTSLCVPGIAVIDAAFGNQQHTAMLLSQQSRIKSGNSASDYYVIEMSDNTLQVSTFVIPDRRFKAKGDVPSPFLL